MSAGLDSEPTEELIARVSGLKNSENKVISLFQITGNPKYKQFLTGRESHDPRYLERGKELIDSNELVEKIINKSIEQMAQESVVARQQEEIAKYFDELRETVCQWLDGVQQAMTAFIGNRLSCQVFMRKFKSGRLKSDDAFKENLSSVIMLLDDENQEKLNKPVEKKEGLKINLDASLMKLEKLKEQINLAIENFKANELPASATRESHFLKFDDGLGMGGGAAITKESQSLNKKGEEPKTEEKPKEGELIQIKGEETKEDGKDLGFEKTFSSFGTCAQIKDIQASGPICRKGKGLVHLSQHPCLYAMMGSDGTVTVFEDQEEKGYPITAQEKFEVGTPDADSSLSASPDGKRLLVGGYNSKNLFLVDGYKLNIIQTWKSTSAHRLWNSTFIGNNHIVAGYNDGQFKIYEEGKPNCIYWAGPCPSGARAVCRGLSLNEVFIGYENSSIYLWDIYQNTSKWVQKHQTNALYSLSICLSNKVLASGSWDNSVVLINAVNGMKLQHLLDFTSTIMSVDFSGKGNNILVTSWKEQVLYSRNEKQQWERSATRKKTFEEANQTHSVAVNWKKGYVLVGNEKKCVFRVELSSL